MIRFVARTDVVENVEGMGNPVLFLSGTLLHSLGRANKTAQGTSVPVDGSLAAQAFALPGKANGVRIGVVGQTGVRQGIADVDDLLALQELNHGRLSGSIGDEEMLGNGAVLRDADLGVRGNGLVDGCARIQYVLGPL